MKKKTSRKMSKKRRVVKKSSSRKMSKKRRVVKKRSSRKKTKKVIMRGGVNVLIKDVNITKITKDAEDDSIIENLTIINNDEIEYMEDTTIKISLNQIKNIDISQTTSNTPADSIKITKINDEKYVFEKIGLKNEMNTFIENAETHINERREHGISVPSKRQTPF